MTHGSDHHQSLRSAAALIPAFWLSASWLLRGGSQASLNLTGGSALTLFILRI